MSAEGLGFHFAAVPWQGISALSAPFGSEEDLFLLGKQEIFLQNVMLKNTQKSVLEKTENRAGFCGSPLDGVTQL